MAAVGDAGAAASSRDHTNAIARPQTPLRISALTAPTDAPASRTERPFNGKNDEPSHQGRGQRTKTDCADPIDPSPRQAIQYPNNRDRPDPSPKTQQQEYWNAPGPCCSKVIRCNRRGAERM